jgi:acyl-CoA synthetase (NDP forming)
MGAPEGRDLDYDELTELLAAYGIDLWPRRVARSEDEAVAAGDELGWDVVLKATAERLRHRPDLAHVRRHIHDADEMREIWRELQAAMDSPDSADFIVQRTAGPGVGVVVSGKEDPLFGPVVSFGLSGLATELLGDRSYRIPPMHAGDVTAMIREIKAAPLLFGYRGGRPVDTGAVEDLLLRVAEMKDDLPQLREVELGLVIAGVQGTCVLTARGRVEPTADARADWFARRLSVQAGDTQPG